METCVGDVYSDVCLGCISQAMYVDFYVIRWFMEKVQSVRTDVHVDNCKHTEKETKCSNLTRTCQVQYISELNYVSFLSLSKFSAT